MTDATVDVNQLLSIIKGQQESIDRLTRLVEADEGRRSTPTASTPPPSAPPNTPPDWFRLTGRDRLLAWEGLANFVEAMVTRFNLYLDIRPCWWKHSDAIEELTALWMVRRSCYRDGAGIDGATRYIDQLRRTNERLRHVMMPCRDGHIISAMGSRVWMDDAMREEFIEAVRYDLVSADRVREF